ncbi:2-acylglycerol O-acyltransferase 2-A-like [Liolophura sinensis]|uniref:2-acylglycerol O-acyltransferase 2-A-like n=1 Tax=Liolophura sinensis TaxID=3198878 RepID=UPI003158D482
MKLFGIEFAPLWIPAERRFQTFAVFQWTMCFLFLGFFCLGISLYILLCTSYYYIILAYLAWYIYDHKTPARGGRRSDWARNWKIWHYFRDYFPISLVKTAELDPKKNYIFGYHPHGIMSAGAFCNFATEATGFSKIFAGIRPYLSILSGQFVFPFHRDYFMCSGMVEVSKDSMNYVLSGAKGTGNAFVVVVGGAVEALEARPDNYTLTIKSRKGFVKMALKHGASLVPVFSFGENELFTQMSNPRGSKLKAIQIRLTKMLGFSPPIFHGRGIFNYTFGLIPYRKPIHTVVGKPIDVEKTPEPTSEQIEALHNRYLNELRELFEQHKTKYGVKEMKHLVIE